MNLIKNSLKATITIALALLVSCTIRTKQSQTTAQLPKTGFIPAANHDNGWQKLADGPVLGNSEMGTCFDVNVIPDGPSKYNMYFSWRPKMAISLRTGQMKMAGDIIIGEAGLHLADFAVSVSWRSDCGASETNHQRKPGCSTDAILHSLETDDRSEIPGAWIW